MAIRRFLKAVPAPAQLNRSHGESGVQPYAPVAHDESNWLVSYADLMTLLCGFFILLFSMSKLDDPKYEKVKAEVAKTFGGKYTAPPTQAVAKLAQDLVTTSGLSGAATVQVEAGGVAIAFESTLFFDTLSAEVKPEGQAVLGKLIEALKAQQYQSGQRYKIVVEGHTDSRPVLGGPYPTNWELSSARAARVVRMFTDQGFEPIQMTAIGYGDTRPVAAPRATDGSWIEAALAKNRRVVLRVLDPKVDAIPFPESPAFASGLGQTADATATVAPPTAVRNPAQTQTQAQAQGQAQQQAQAPVQAPAQAPNWSQPTSPILARSTALLPPASAASPLPPPPAGAVPPAPVGAAPSRK